MLRLGAIVILVLPLALGFTLRDLAWGAWLGVGLASAIGIAIAIARPRARSLVLLGTVLAAVAGLMIPQLSRPGGDAAVLVDLRHDELAGDLRGPARVTGFYRDEWMLAEYAVAQGALPQQDEPAIAQLVPFFGVEDGAIPLRGAVLVVRVRPGDESAAGVQTLQGQARALDSELLATFVQASGLDVPAGVEGVLLDTLAPIDATPAWVRAGLATLAILAAFVCLWIATRSEP